MSPLVADGIALGHVILGYAMISFLLRFMAQVGQALFVTMLALLFIMPISWVWARRTGAPLVALAAAGDGGQVSLEARAAENKLLLMVANDGEYISDESRPGRTVFSIEIPYALSA
jgi:hypothetical protein